MTTINDKVNDIAMNAIEATKNKVESYISELGCAVVKVTDKEAAEMLIEKYF